MSKLRPIAIMGHHKRDGAIFRSTIVETESGHTDILFTRIGRLEFLLWRIKRAFAGLFE